MTFALWTLLAAGILPYVCAATAKFGGPGYDNATPRPSLDNLTGWRQRADWAQRNHFEAFPLFATAILTAHLTHAPQPRIDLLAATFLLARIAYSIAYITNRPTLRSAFWAAGFLCVILLFCAGMA